MVTVCKPLIQGIMLRATRLDPECGEPVVGPCSTVTTKGFISVAMSDDVTAPEAISQVGAGGELIYSEQSDPQLNFVTTEVTLGEANPNIYEIMSGGPLVLDASGAAVGNDDDTSTYGKVAFALEIWTKIAKGNAACPPGGAQYGYILLPWMAKTTIGDLTVENAGLSFVLSAQSQNGTPWGVGPYNVTRDVGGNPSPLLTPIASTLHRRRMITQLPPPAAVCDCQAILESA